MAVPARNWHLTLKGRRYRNIVQYLNIDDRPRLSVVSKTFFQLNKHCEERIRVRLRIAWLRAYRYDVIEDDDTPSTSPEAERSGRLGILTLLDPLFARRCRLEEPPSLDLHGSRFLLTLDPGTLGTFCRRAWWRQYGIPARRSDAVLPAPPRVAGESPTSSSRRRGSAMLEVNADVVGVVLSFLAFPDRQRLRQVCRTTRGWVNDFSANIVQRVTGIADGSGVSALALLCPGIGGVVTPLGGRVGQRRRAVQLVDAEVVQEYLVALKRGPGNIMEIFQSGADTSGGAGVGGAGSGGGGRVGPQ